MRAIKLHYKDIGHGCDAAGLKAWVLAKTEACREFLVLEGRQLFDPDAFDPEVSR